MGPDVFHEGDEAHSQICKVLGSGSCDDPPLGRICGASIALSQAYIPTFELRSRCLLSLYL